MAEPRGEGAEDRDARHEGAEPGTQASHAHANQPDAPPSRPSRDTHPSLVALREFVSEDLEWRWRRGRPRPLEDYRLEYPELFESPSAVAMLAYKEYRLRHEAGEDPTPGEYERRFGVETSAWRRAPDAAGLGPPTAQPTETTPDEEEDSFGEELTRAFDQPGADVELERAAQSYQRVRAEGAAPETGAAGGTGPFARLFDELHRSSPQVAERLAETIVALPKVGDKFAGFRLVAILGNGAFGRVYLARQADLANRYVALKVTADLRREPERLARLQHTNIVPIHSVHAAGPLQAVCMPYYGATTLAHVLADLRQRPSVPADGRELVDLLRQRRGGRRPAAPPMAPAAERGPTAGPLRTLEGLSYVGSILWLGARLADGLVHAHERGILHRDLKPANVLLTDDGQPMLLDFNVSEEVQPLPSLATAVVVGAGGTLTYMAPEHLEAFRGGKQVVDGRADVYALGIILYELLTRRHPFPVARRRGSPPSVAAMVEARYGPLPLVRRWNPAVSPAVESIIRHCLEADPRRRYQSAADLREDLERQQQDLPLRHAPERSLRERAGKWWRRHPSLARALVVSVLLVVLAGGAGGWHGQRLAREEVWQAESAFQQWQADSRPVRYYLGARVYDSAARREGMTRAAELLARYGALERPSWRQGPLVHRLPPEQQAALTGEVGEMLFLLARARLIEAAGQQEPERSGTLRLARQLNGLAETGLGMAAAGLEAQRAELDALIGQSGGPTASPVVEAATSRDRFLLALGRLDRKDYAGARDLLVEVTREDPRDVSAWVARGVCHDRLGEFDRSVACYSAAIALWPDFALLYDDRGLAQFNNGRWAEARADFDEAIRRQPEAPQPYVDRALAWQELKRYPEAIADLDRALALGMDPCRVYLLRAQVRERAGDREGARRDREVGLRLDPADEATWRARGEARLITDPAGALADFERALALEPNSLRGMETRPYVLGRLEQAWNERGLKRVERDPKGALADFEKVLELNPRSWLGLMNKAHALENLGRLEEAVKVLGEAAGVPHENAESRSARGVLLARLGRR